MKTLYFVVEIHPVYGDENYYPYAFETEKDAIEYKSIQESTKKTLFVIRKISYVPSNGLKEIKEKEKQDREKFISMLKKNKP